MKVKPKPIESGDVYKTNEGGSVTVIAYTSASNILVEHNDKYKHRDTVQAGHLRRGGIKNPYHPRVFGKGFIGVGRHDPSCDGKDTEAYKIWASMLRRSYDPKYHAKRPSYEGCYVQDEWHNFQNFAEWLDNEPNAYNKGFELDKDLSGGGRKEYSKRYCSFVPCVINSLLNGNSRARGKYPQGVSAHGKGFRPELSVKGNPVWLGTYSTPEQAFKVYKAAKEQNVKSMAIEWKDWITPKVFDYLMSYTVEITD